MRRPEVSSPDRGLDASSLARLIAVGGWPAHGGFTVERSARAIRDYLDEIRRVDVPRLGGPRRDPDRVERVLRSLARHVATFAAATTIAADAGGSEGPLDDDSVRDNLAVLDRIMIIEDQPAWGPHLRSRSILRTTPKRHFVDPSLAVAALRGSPEGLLRDLDLMGLLFASLVVRDVRVYAQASDARVLQYRDNTGLDIDIVVQAADGRWAAFEVKLGPSQADEGASALLRFVDRIDTARVGAPSILGVIVGFGYGFVRRDGIAVIPIGSLGP